MKKAQEQRPTFVTLSVTFVLCIGARVTWFLGNLLQTFAQNSELIQAVQTDVDLTKNHKGKFVKICIHFKSAYLPSIWHFFGKIRISSIFEIFYEIQNFFGYPAFKMYPIHLLWKNWDRRHQFSLHLSLDFLPKMHFWWESRNHYTADFLVSFSKSCLLCFIFLF